MADLATKFDFAAGNKLKDEALADYIAGLSPRAAIEFAEYQSLNIIEKAVKKTRTRRTKK